MDKSLSKISTEWSEIENIADRDGVAVLAEYLVVKYFEVVVQKFKRYSPQLDDLKIHELASDVLYELIKNDYRGIKRLDRQRGHLRGLFFRIIKTKLYEMGKKHKSKPLDGFDKEENMDHLVDMYLDLDTALSRLKQEKPRLYEPFYHFYLEGKKISEIATLMGIQENAIKQRLYTARRCLSKWLEDYATD